MRNQYCQRKARQEDKGHWITVLITLGLFTVTAVLVIIKNGI